MKRCEQYEHLLSEGLDRKLAPHEQTALDAHLLSCRSCREFAIAVAHQSKILQSLPLETAPGELTRRVAPLRKTFLSRLWYAQVTVPLPAVAAIALLIGAGLFAVLFDTNTPDTGSPSVEPTIEYVQVEVVPASTAKPLKTSAPASKE